MRVELTDRDQTEQDAIFDYILAHSPSGAEHVIAALEEAFGLIAAYPEIGKQTRRPGVRAASLARYPDRIFYRVHNDMLEVLHIRHTARRPWTG